MSCSRSRRHCCNDPVSFYYICGEYIVKGHKTSITDFVRKIYHAYFRVKVGDQDNLWFHMLSAKCVWRTYRYGKKAKSFRIGVPVVWREQKKKHPDHCYLA